MYTVYVEYGRLPVYQYVSICVLLGAIFGALLSTGLGVWRLYSRYEDWQQWWASLEPEDEEQEETVKEG